MIANALKFIQQNYVGFIALLAIAYVVYNIYDMFSEKTEPNEMEPNYSKKDYAPVAYNTVKFKNFNIDELTCKDGTKVPAQYTGNAYRLLQQLQILRDHINLPIVINSGYRSPSHNAKVKGKKNSSHLTAMAADIVVLGMRPADVHATILQLIKEGKMQDGGLGKYNTFTHYDVSNPRRW